MEGVGYRLRLDSKEGKLIQNSLASTEAAMKNILGLALCVIIALVVAVGLYAVYAVGKQAGSKSQMQFTSSGPTVDQLIQLSELAVLRVQVSDVLIGGNDNARIAILVRGDADMSVDLSKTEVAKKSAAGAASDHGV